MKTVFAPGLPRCRSGEKRIPLGAEQKDDPFLIPGSLTSLCTLIKQQVRTDATHAQNTPSFDWSGSRVRKKRCVAETVRFVGGTSVHPEGSSQPAPGGPAAAHICTGPVLSCRPSPVGPRSCPRLLPKPRGSGPVNRARETLAVYLSTVSLHMS